MKQIPLALQLPGVVPSELLGRRPDIVAARWRVEAADKQIKVAKTRFYPSLNLTALAGVVAPNVGDLLQSSSSFAYIGPALSLPIFEGGKLRANLANSDAQPGNNDCFVRGKIQDNSFRRCFVRKQVNHLAKYLAHR